MNQEQKEENKTKAGAFDWNEQEEFDSDDEDETFGLHEDQPSVGKTKDVKEDKVSKSSILELK